MRPSTCSPWRAGLTGAVGCLALLALEGCPDVRKGGPDARCVTAYAQCQLPSGALGVCDAVECAPEQAPPCLVCRSQH